MTAIRLLLTAVSNAVSIAPDPVIVTKKAALICGADSFIFDIIKPESSVDDLGHIEWAELQRPQSLPWLVDSSRRLPKYKYSAKLWKNGDAVDEDIRRLEFMSSRPGVMTFAYGAYETGNFRMTSLTAEAIQRQPGTNNIIEADVSFTLTRANDIPQPLPVPNAPAPPVAVPATPASAPAKREYTIVKGDSLWRISQKFYGAGDAFNRIAEANGIKDVNRIVPGQKLTIP